MFMSNAYGKDVIHLNVGTDKEHTIDICTSQENEYQLASIFSGIWFILATEMEYRSHEFLLNKFDEWIKFYQEQPSR